MKHLKCLGLAVLAAMALTALLGAGAASATTLQAGGKNLPAGSEFVTTLQSGSSSIMKDEFGTTTDTCTQSENRNKTTNETGAQVTSNVTLQQTSSCTHLVTVLKNGKGAIEWTSGLNGRVIASESEVTVMSTFFGASAVCKTGTGTTIGTLTGSKEGHATMDVNAKINCGILGTGTLTSTYTVTSPTGLTVVP
jgi:hypothetical protein